MIILVTKEEKQISGSKLCEKQISFLCCANANGLHKLKLIVAGKAKHPCSLHGVMAKLSIVWFHNVKTWFTIKLFVNFFHQIIWYTGEIWTY